MVSILVSNAILEETRLIKSVSTEIFFRYVDALKIIVWDMSEELNTVIEKMDTLDAAIIDVTHKDGIEAAKELRKKYEEIEILIISDITISPVLYLNPEVKATSLLLKPLRKEEVSKTFSDFFDGMLDSNSGNDCYLINKKNEQIRIPYNKIIYFEAKNKKIYVRLNNVEYGVAETMEHLLKQLPEEFFRCHRSYIVNVVHVKNVNYSENLILLTGDMEVPMSRSYKTSVKEVMKNG